MPFRSDGTWYSGSEERKKKLYAPYQGFKEKEVIQPVEGRRPHRGKEVLPKGPKLPVKEHVARSYAVTEKESPGEGFRSPGSSTVKKPVKKEDESIRDYDTGSRNLFKDLLGLTKKDKKEDSDNDQKNQSIRDYDTGSRNLFKDLLSITEKGKKKENYTDQTDRSIRDYDTGSRNLIDDIKSVAKNEQDLITGPFEDRYKPGNTSISELISRPLDTLFNTASLGAIKRDYSEPDNVAEQVADKIGQGLGLVLGGGAAKAAGGKVLGTAGKQIKSVGESLFKLKPRTIPPIPNPKTLTSELATLGLGTAAFAGTKPFAEGFSEPGLEDKSFAQKSGGNIRAGFYDQVVDIGNYFKSQGKHDMGDKLVKIGEKNREGFTTDYGKEFSWRSFVDPEYYATTISRTIPSSISFLGLGLLGSSAGGAAAGALGLGTFGRTVLSVAGGSGFSSATESAMIGGSTYEEAKRRGHDEQAAANMADEAFNKALAINFVLGVPEIAAIFPGAGKFMPQVKNAFANLSLRTGTVALTEGTQEALQEWAVASTLGDEFNWDRAKEPFALGAFMGGAMGLGSALLSPVQTETEGIEGDTESVNSQMPTQEEAAAPVRDIKQRAKEIMSDEMRAGFDEEVRANQENGATPEQAESLAWEALSMTEDGKKVITEATQETVGRNLVEEMDETETTQAAVSNLEATSQPTPAIDNTVGQTTGKNPSPGLAPEVQSMPEQPQTEVAPQEQTVPESMQPQGEKMAKAEFDGLMDILRNRKDGLTQGQWNSVKNQVKTIAENNGYEVPEDFQIPEITASQDETMTEEYFNEVINQLRSRKEELTPEKWEHVKNQVKTLADNGGFEVPEDFISRSEIEDDIDTPLSEGSESEISETPELDDEIAEKAKKEMNDRDAAFEGAKKAREQLEDKETFESTHRRKGTGKEVEAVIFTDKNGNKQVVFKGENDKRTSGPVRLDSFLNHSVSLDEVGAISSLSENDILNRAVVDMVQASGQSTTLNFQLDNNNKKAAEKSFNSMIEDGYEKNGLWEVSKEKDVAEITTIDGRTFSPKIKALFNRYVDIWNRQLNKTHQATPTSDNVFGKLFAEQEQATPPVQEERPEQAPVKTETEKLKYEFEVKTMKNENVKVTVNVPDSNEKVDFIFTGRGPLKGNLSSALTREGKTTISDTIPHALGKLKLPENVLMKQDNMIAALEGKDFKTSDSVLTEVDFVDHRDKSRFEVYSYVKSEIFTDDLPFIPDFTRLGKPVQTYFFTANDEKNYVIFREEGREPGQPQPADVFLKRAELMDLTDPNILDTLEGYKQPTYNTTLEDLSIDDYVEFTDGYGSPQKGFVAEFTKDGLVILENAKGKRPFLPLEPNRLKILDQEEAPERTTEEKFITVEQKPLLLTEPIEMNYTRNPTKRNRIEITFNKEIPSQVKAMLQEMSIRYVKSQKVYAGAFSDEKLKKVANLKMFLKIALNKKQVEALKKMNTKYRDEYNLPNPPINTVIPSNLSFYKDTFYLIQTGLFDYKEAVYELSEYGSLRKTAKYKKEKDLPPDRILLGDVRNITEDVQELPAQEPEIVEPDLEERQDTVAVVDDKTKLEYVFFAIQPHDEEIKAINERKPENILLSFFYWKEKNIKKELLDKLTYKPRIIIDSGAYTFFTKGIDSMFDAVIERYLGDYELEPQEVIPQIRLSFREGIIDDDTGEFSSIELEENNLFLKYVDWLNSNSGSYDYVIAFDSIGDQDLSNYGFDVMRSEDLNLIPVATYSAGGTGEYNAESVNGMVDAVRYFVEKGADYVALGGLSTPKIKNKRNLRSRIAKEVTEQFPGIKFHFLGTLDKRIIDQVPGLTSADGTAWITSAISPRNRKEGQTKLDAAKDNLDRMGDMQKNKKASFKENDRVTFTSNGKELSGRIRNIDEERNTANVDVDQIMRAGGVPIGRVEVVSLDRLNHERQKAAETEKPQFKKGDQIRHTITNKIGTYLYEGIYSDGTQIVHVEVDGVRTKWGSDKVEPVQELEQLTTKENEETTTEDDKIISGDTTTVTTTRGTEVEVSYALVEVNDLIASHNTDGTTNNKYPSELQPRQRTRAESQIQIDRIAGKLNPNLLGANPLASDGSPIIGKDLIVESGNGRAIALKKVFSSDEYQDRQKEYVRWLFNQSGYFGLTSQQINSMANPVLVRVRTSDIDRVQFTQEANEASVSAMSATEQAMEDAKKMSGGLMNLFGPTDTGELNTSTNRDFIRSFMDKVVSPNERNRLTTAQGFLSQDGINRVRNAVFAFAFGDVQAVSTLSEATDSNVKTVMNQLLSVASRVAYAQDQINSGTFYELGISKHLVEAMNTLSDIRRNDQKVEEYLNQLSFFEELSPISKEILRFYNNYGSGKKGKPASTISAVVLEYYRGLEALGSPNQEQLFKTETPTVEQLLEISLRKVTADDSLQNSLFETEKEQDLFDDRPDTYQDEQGNQTGSSTTPDAEETEIEETTTAAPRPPQQPPAEPEPTKYDFARDKLGWLDNLAKKADKYMKDNKDRINVLPVDIFGAAAIVGANKIAHGVIDFAEWSEQMMTEYGRQLRLSLRALYAQSEDMLTFSQADWDEYLESVGLTQLNEEIEENEDGNIEDYEDLGETPAPAPPQTKSIRFKNRTQAINYFAMELSNDQKFQTYLDMNRSDNYKQIYMIFDRKIRDLITDYWMPVINAGGDIKANLMNDLFAEETKKKILQLATDRVRQDILPGGEQNEHKVDGGESLEEQPTGNVPPTGTGGETGTSSGKRSDQVRGNDRSSNTGNREDVSSEEGSELSGQSKTQTKRPELSNGFGQRGVISNRQKLDFEITTQLNEKRSAAKRFEDNQEALKTLFKIENEGRFATKEEQESLVKYVGWGGLREAFTEGTPQYREIRDLVDTKKITQEEWMEMADTVTSSFYTPPILIDQMYRALDKMGFKSGQILESSVGTGNFIGLMPTSIKANSNIIGIEKDSITSRIAKQLYQKVKINHTPFQNYKISDNYFDLSIGNVPFGGSGVSDKNYKGPLSFVTSLIHDYFIIKSLDKVRDGGIVALITTKGSLDKKSMDIRNLISEKADFLGAIRLPENAFKSANTGVVSDIIFLQKRKQGKEPNHVDDFIKLKTVKVSGKSFKMNEYFVNHPEMVIGKKVAVTNQYGDALSFKFDGDFEAAFKKVIQNLPENIYKERSEQILEDYSDELNLDVTNETEDTIIEKDGSFFQVQEGRLIPYIAPRGKEGRLKGLLGVRKAVNDLLQLEKSQTAKDSEVEAARKVLNKVYDGFVAKNGFINEKVNLDAIKADSLSLALLASLENYKESGTKTAKTYKNSAKKEQIFIKRILTKAQPIEKVDTAHEALALSLFKFGKINMDYMKTLSSKTTEQIETELGDAIYLDPELDAYVTSDEYLSGNVREKLNFVESNNKDGKYNKHVSDLEKVIPKWLEMSEDRNTSPIVVSLGSHWIPKNYYEGFIKEVLDVNAIVTHHLVDGSWYLDLTGTWKYPNREDWGVKSTKGKSLLGTDIVNLLMNQKDVKVTYTYESRTYVDEAATLVAKNKAEMLQNEFQNWLVKDPNRMAHLENIYNNTFNAVNLRNYNGEILYGTPDNEVVIPNLNSKFKMFKHQKDAIYRVIQGMNTLLAHVVGAGKTLEMIVSGMEGKRLGLWNKPMYVVPKPLLDQWEKDFKEAYPTARILKITNEGNNNIPTVKPSKRKDQTEKTYNNVRAANRQNRYKALNKIRFGDYDAILITHGTFQRLPVSPETEQAFIREQIQELADTIREAQSSGNDKKSVLKLQTSLQKLERRLLDNINEEIQDVGIPFEELGIDQIFVDEAHMFKNLMFTTKMNNVSGLPRNYSQRAQDMFMKTKWLTETNNGRGVVFATGTPIANSVAELYTMIRYLALPRLKELGIEHFDSWASMFGKIASDMEMDATGTYKEKTRFSSFHNIPELLKIFKGFADVKTAADLPYLDVPKKVDRITVDAEMSPEQEAYIKELQTRAIAVKSGRVDKTEDNPLKISGDGRKNALDGRLVQPKTNDFEGSKINKAIDNIANIYNETKTGFKDKETGEPLDNLAQLVFLDLGTPKKKSNKDTDSVAEDDDEELEFEKQLQTSVYQDIKNKLIRKKVKAGEIAFIHDAKSDKDRLELFQKVRSGEVRVLIGSTEKMGAGMNVQDRLYALHHLDAPWRPSDVEQREGRIIRQKNKLDNVKVFTYVTVGSFDAITWKILQIKAKFINQMMTGDDSMRSADDIDEIVEDYTNLAVAASGNPLYEELIKVQKELKSVSALKQDHLRKKRENERKTREIPNMIREIQANVEIIKSDTDRLNLPQDFEMVLDGKKYTERKEASEALQSLVLLSEPNTKIGEYAGFDIINLPEAIALKGRAEYKSPIDLGKPDGFMIRLQNLTKAISLDLQNENNRMDYWEKELEGASKNVNNKFVEEEKFQTLLNREQEISRELTGDAESTVNQDQQPTPHGSDTVLIHSIGSGFRGTTDQDTFVEPVNPEPEGTGEERQSWRGKLFRNRAQEEEKSINRTKIVRFLSEAFHVPMGTGKYKGRAKGIYKRNVNVIRTKDFADFVALAHELGHRLDDQFNFSLKIADGEQVTIEEEEEMFQELHDLAIKNLNPDIINDTVPLATIRREGFAEFVRLYFDNPSQIFSDLPKFNEYFIEKLNKSDWDKKRLSQDQKREYKDKTKVLDALDIAADMIDLWRGQSPEDRIDGVISYREDRGLSLKNLSSYVKEKGITGQYEFYDSLFDELQPIERAVQKLTGEKYTNRTLPGYKDPYIQAWNARGASGKIKTFIEFGVVDENGKKVGPSLKEILSLVPDFKTFNRYLTAKHAKDLIKNHGKVKTPIKVTDADKIINNAEEEYIEAAEMLYEFQESITNELVRSGFLDTKQIDEWKLMYPYHVPFYRVMEDMGERDTNKQPPTSPGKRYANQQNPVKRMKETGSARNIIDPVESIIKNTYMYLQIAERNDVGRSLADLVDKTEDSAWLMEKLDRPLYPQKFSLDEVKKTLENANVEIENADMDQVATIFRPIFMPKVSDQELTVYRAGNPVYYQVKDRVLFNSLLSLEKDTMNWLTKLLSGPNQLLKRAITATPDFIVRQFFRTWGATMIQTESYQRFGGLEALKMPFHAVGNLIDIITKGKKTERYYEWLSGGGASSTLQELDKSYMKQNKKSLLSLQEKGLKVSRLKNALNPMTYLNMLNEAGQTLDEIFRMAEYQEALRKTGDREKSVQRSRDVDYDPARFGSKTRNLNRTLLFFNPAIQGLEKTFRTYRKHPFITTMRGLVFLTLPTLALLLVNWDDEDYWELPSWRRDMFWNFKISDGHFLSVPIPFEWGIMFKTLPERLVAKFAEDEGLNTEIKGSFDEFGKNVFKMLAPDIIPSIIAPIIEWKTNTKLSFGTPIVPMGLQGENPGEQYNIHTSELAKLIGSNFNISPMKMDTFYEGYTGTLGKLPVAAMDKILLATGISDRKGAVPKKDRNLIEQAFKGLLPNVDEGGSTSVNRFFKRLEELELDKKSKNMPGFVEPELKYFRSVAAEMADMRAMRNWIVLDNTTLSPEEKATWIRDINRTIVDYARVSLGKEVLNQASSSKVFDATKWFTDQKEKMESQNRKKAKEKYGY